MRKVRYFMALLAVIALCSGGAAAAATITMSCGAVGLELKLCKQAAGEWAAETGNEVKVVSTPDSSSARLALYQQILASKSSDIDVYQIDIVWPGLLGEHFIDLKPYIKEKRLNKYFDSIVNALTVDGKLVAMPWWTDAGLLYYRKDLLKKYDRPVPKTWAQLQKTAKMIMEAERAAGNEDLWGFVWQGRAYEGLTCDALEWVASYGGGTIISDDGEITINNPQAVKALEMAASWVGTISPIGVLSYAEEESRGVFHIGNAVFMRNWPYAWALSQSEDSPVKGKVGVAALPAGGENGRHVGALGGWNLAVSKYSKHPDLAADLVMYLTGYEIQKSRAIAAGYNPTIKALYKDEEVLEAVPFFGSLYEIFLNAVARPSAVTGDNYNRVSNAFYTAVHEVLEVESDVSADKALADLETELRRIKRRGGPGW